MKLYSGFLLASVFLGALPACPPGTNVAPIISNGAACAIDIIEDVTAAIDIAATAKDCGTTALEIYQLVSQLLKNMPPVNDAATPIITTQKGLVVARADYVNHLQAWQVAAKAAAGVK